MFDRFTEQAAHTVYFAREATVASGNKYIETEYLLLGLLKADEKLAARHNMPLAEVQAEIEAIAHPREKVPGTIDPEKDIPLSKASKMALARAAEEADKRKGKHIGTKYLLFGLMQANDVVTSRIFTNHKLRSGAGFPLILMPSPATKIIVDGAIERAEGSFVEPHHLALAVLQNPAMRQFFQRFIPNLVELETELEKQRPTQLPGDTSSTNKTRLES